MNLQDLVQKHRAAGDLAVMPEIAEYLKAKPVQLPSCNVPPEKTIDALQVALWMQDMHSIGRKASNWTQAAERMSKYAVMKGLWDESTGSAGGVLVPDVVHTSLISLMEGDSLFLYRMSRYAMDTDRKIVPTADSKLSVGWHNESEAVTEGAGTFGSAVLQAKRLDAYVKLTNELLEDSSIGIAGTLASQFAEQAAQKIDQTVISGDGTSAYADFSGIFTAAAGYSEVFSSGSTHFSAILATNLINAKNKVPSYIRRQNQSNNSRAIFIMHSDILGYLSKQQDAAGHYLLPPYGDLDLRLHGYHILESHKAPGTADTAAAKACAAFIEPSYLCFGDRKRTQVFHDPYTQSLSNQSIFILMLRMALAWGKNAACCRIMTAA
jgi:HK97 family phage major capsid protein